MYRLNVGLTDRPYADFVSYALDNAAIVAVTDIQGTITYVNNKFCEISGYSQTELIGSNHRILNSRVHDRPFFRSMYRQIASGQVWHGEICNRNKSGSLYWVDTTIVPHVSKNGKPDSYTAIRFDITARKKLEKELRASKDHMRHIANHDYLTKLPNRRHFQEVISNKIKQCRHSGKRFSLGLMDIDVFKEINDSFGHQAGDKILRSVASRILNIGDRHLFLARLDGDEFGLIYEGEQSDTIFIFNSILETIRQPLKIAGTHRRYSASMGVAIFPEHGDDEKRLFQSADLALYRAKSLGRDRFEVATPVLLETAQHRAQMLEEIENALRDKALEIHYQPIVPMSVDSPVSLEALMRWRHPERGLLSPAIFQPEFPMSMIGFAAGQNIGLGQADANKRAEVVPIPAARPFQAR